MNISRPLIFSLVLAAAMSVFAFVTASRLPADAVLPTHWNASGEADGFSPALWALMMPAGMVAIVSLLFATIPSIEPLQDRLENSAPVLRATWIGMIFLFLIIQAVIALPTYGIALSVNSVLVGVGILILMLGNALPKSRPGLFVGIRTPWTLRDTDNWIATHRLGGKLAMLAGAAIILASLFSVTPQTTTSVIVIGVFAMTIIPIFYSWWLSRRGAGLSE